MRKGQEVVDRNAKCIQRTLNARAAFQYSLTIVFKFYLQSPQLVHHIIITPVNDHHSCRDGLLTKSIDRFDENAA